MTPVSGRILTRREWLGVFAETLGLVPSEFQNRVDLPALDAALEAPAAQWRGQPIHESLAEQAAVLTETMLRRPPFDPAPRQFAFLTMLLFIDHSGAALDISVPQREGFLREIETSPPSRERLIEWIDARLREHVTPRSPPTGTLAAPAPVVYVALPVQSASDDVDLGVDLAEYADAVRTVVQNFAKGRGWPDVRVEIPGRPYVGSNASSAAPTEPRGIDEEITTNHRNVPRRGAAQANGACAAHR